MRRWGLTIFLMLLSAALASALTVTVIWVRSMQPPRAPLIDSLDANFKTADVEFNRRLHARFPVGISVKDLIEGLRREGFRPGWPGQGEATAALQWGNLVCNMGARVWWESDANGRVVSLRGRYGEEGCL